MTPESHPRWWTYVKERRLFCGPPGVGHHIPSTFHVLECGFIRCNHWHAESKSECGRWVFALAVRGGKIIVAEVALDEIEGMRKLGTPAEIIDYLGIFERMAG